MEGAEAIDRIILHYIDGRIQVEVWLPIGNLRSLEQAGEVSGRLRAACASDPQIESLEVLFR